MRDVSQLLSECAHNQACVHEQPGVLSEEQ